MAFSIDNANQQMNTAIDTVGQQMSGLLAKSSSQQLSEEDMLQLQNSMNRWSIMISMETNIQKTWGDTLKSIASNLR